MTRPDERLALRSESQDPRAVRTRTLLVEAAKDHLRQAPAAEMSVSSIVKAAGVSRQVFYQHFADLDALVYTTGQQVLGGAYEKFAARFDTAEDFGEAVSVLAQNLSGQYEILIHLIDSPVHAQLDAYVYEIMTPTLRDALKGFIEQRGQEHSEETIELLAHFFIAGAQELLEDGVRKGLKEEDLAARVQKVAEILSIQ